MIDQEKEQTDVKGEPDGPALKTINPVNQLERQALLTMRVTQTGLISMGVPLPQVAYYSMISTMRLFMDMVGGDPDVFTAAVDAAAIKAKAQVLSDAGHTRDPK